MAFIFLLLHGIEGRGGGFEVQPGESQEEADWLQNPQTIRSSYNRAAEQSEWDFWDENWDL